MEFHSTIEKNEIMSFVTTWIDLEGILLSEISQTEKDKCAWNDSYVESKKYIDIDIIDTENRFLVARGKE